MTPLGRDGSGGVPAEEAVALSRSGLGFIFEAMSKRLGKKIRPNGLRHFAVTAALRDEFSWEEVMAQ